MDLPEPKLEPLSYHVEVREYLKARERELWDWFASARAKADYAENLRRELLKSTYRLEPEAHAEVYALVEDAKAKLNLEVPLTLYQAQRNSQPNASLYFLPDEGHIVFCGPVLSLLNAAEIKAVIGHELAHFHLWRQDGGEFHIADRLLQAVADDPRASASHEQTARRFQLYTEIFADRGSLRVTGSVDPVIAGLVKIETGLPQVSATGYLKQAQEIFANGNVPSKGLSHPEVFIRARAVALWHEERAGFAQHIKEMIEGATTLDELDLIDQSRSEASTRRLLEQLLQPKWFQTPACLGLARLFFDDFVPGPTRDPAVLAALTSELVNLEDYVCYLLLDFVTADPDLDDLPLAAALELSRALNLEADFERLAIRELKMKTRDLRHLKERAADMLAKAEVQGG